MEISKLLYLYSYYNTSFIEAILSSKVFLFVFKESAFSLIASTIDSLFSVFNELKSPILATFLIAVKLFTYNTPFIEFILASKVLLFVPNSFCNELIEDCKSECVWEAAAAPISEAVGL